MDTNSEVTEIERKYLVLRIPDGEHDTYSICQGYLDVHGAQVRVRKSRGDALLTIKAGSSLSRTEVELTLTDNQFRAIWPLTEGRRIRKKRTLVPLGQGMAELDVFEGPLFGLLLVEVEFDSLAAADKFSPPDWFGEEVTNEETYKNSALAHLTSAPKTDNLSCPTAG